MNRLLAVLGSAVVLAAGAGPVAAQPRDALTPCTEVLAGASIVIGHDCGEWASIVIVANIVIRKPWSQVIGASRAARMGANRDRTGAATAEPTKTPRRTRETRTPAAETTTMFGVDISQGNPDELDCPDFAYQEDAQELFDAQGWSETNDPYHLDESGRGDGVPCEDNPSRG